jgi:hypothetical protein
LRFEPGAFGKAGAAAHQDVGPGGEQPRRSSRAAAGVRHHRRRRGILDFGIGDNADGHAVPALRETRNGLHLRIIERAWGAVGIDAHGIDRGLVAGGVGAGGVRRIGDDRIRARGRHQRHVRHVVDRKLAEALALRDALGEQARGDAVRRRQPVTDEQDDVLRLARSGIIDRPRNGAAARAVADFHRDVARPGQGDAAERQRRLILAVFASTNFHSGQRG